MTEPNPHIANETPNPNTAQESQDQQEQQDQQQQQPQSPQTLALTNQDPQVQTLPDPDPNQDQDTVMEDPIQNADDPEPDTPAVVLAAASSGAGRRSAPKRKKLGPKRTAQEKKSREKLQVLVETLKLVPFAPSKALDFDRHQSLLQRLGLWEFVHIEFDLAVRGDLIAQLIASYVPTSRCSYVNGVRINVSRADLGRALKLPKKNSAAAGAAEGGEPVDLADSIGFVEELVENWMLLHDDAYIPPNEVLVQLNLVKEGQLEKVDWASLMWAVLEKELRAPQLVNCYYASHLQRLIKTQHEELLEEEEEALQGEEEEGEEVGGKDEGEEVEVKDEEEEEDEEDDEEVVAAAAVQPAGEEEEDVSGDVKMGGVDEGGQIGEMEEHNIELSLGQDNVERVDTRQDDVEKVDEGKELVGGEQIMDFEPSKVEEGGLWLMNQKNNVGEPFLRQCNASDVKRVDCGQGKEDEGEEGQEMEEEEEDAEEDEHEGGFNLSPKCIPLQGMPSGTGGLMQAMGAAHMPFGSGIDLRDNPVGDFLSPRDDPQMISGSSLFGNGTHKREISLDNHNAHHTLNGSNKRLRGDSPWNSKPVDFETCMEQIETWMGKARMVYAAKEQACEESSVNQQLLLNELQKRDEMIDHLHKAKMDESHKRQMEVYRLEKELFMMTGLVEGYRKALKETQKAFAEYRARCPQADEPLYKDVPGSGGLVLSVMELEKERLRKEEEERMKLMELEKERLRKEEEELEKERLRKEEEERMKLMELEKERLRKEEEERMKLREFLRDFEKKLRDIEGTWIGKLEDHLCKVQTLGNRLLAVEEQVKHWNEVKAKSKVSDPPECALECAPPSEGQNA